MSNHEFWLMRAKVVDPALSLNEHGKLQFEVSFRAPYSDLLTWKTELTPESQEKLVRLMRYAAEDIIEPGDVTVVRYNGEFVGFGSTKKEKYILISDFFVCTELNYVEMRKVVPCLEELGEDESGF